ncbi:MAG: hypothetical protein Q9181_005074 [Wetmoreana brouardii]
MGCADIRALSRSGKKVLHIDENEYYGGAEAALSLQEAEAWVEQIDASSHPTPFSDVSIPKPPSNDQSPDKGLGFSRAYSISLAPQLIYTRSNLVPALVSSKVYRQLEFLAVGSWWIYHEDGTIQDAHSTSDTDADKQKQSGTLQKIPGSREDVFADKTIDLRSTRSLMKVLKLAADPETYSKILGEHGDRSFTEFLESEYKIASKLQAPLLALTLSPDSPSKTTVANALPRLHRHLTSIGIFGPGFGAVLPKWGGLAEIAQVACRAGAVGGGVYVLKKGIISIDQPSDASTATRGAESLTSTVHLEGGDTVKARWIVGTSSTLPQINNSEPEQQSTPIEVAHVTAIISSPLTSIFLPPAEGSPPPAAVVVVLPPNSIKLPDGVDSSEVPLLYLTVHSSDTGECPEGQCIIYTSTHLTHPSASQLLSSAISTLLASLHHHEPETAQPEILWSLTYKQRHRIPSAAASSSPIAITNSSPKDDRSTQDHGIVYLDELRPSLALEDDALRDVRRVWELITADDAEGRGGFMMFEDREGLGDGEGDEGV